MKVRGGGGGKEEAGLCTRGRPDKWSGEIDNQLNYPLDRVEAGWKVGPRRELIRPRHCMLGKGHPSHVRKLCAGPGYPHPIHVLVLIGQGYRNKERLTSYAMAILCFMGLWRVREAAGVWVEDSR